MKTRVIEMYIGVGSDFGTWSTEYVDIPIDTPEEKIEEVARIKIMEDELAEDFMFCGVYSIPSLDDPENDVDECDDEENYINM